MLQRLKQFFKPTRFKTVFFVVGMIAIFFVRFSSVPVDLNRYYDDQIFGRSVPASVQLYMNVVEAVSFPSYFLTLAESTASHLLCPDICNPTVDKLPVWAMESFYIILDVIYVYLLACVLAALAYGFNRMTSLKNVRVKRAAFVGLTLVVGLAAILYQLSYDKKTTAQVELVVEESGLINYLETRVAGVKSDQSARAFCGYSKYSVHQVGETLTQYLIMRCRAYALKDGKLVEGQTVTTPIVVTGKSTGEPCKRNEVELPCVPEYGFAKPYQITDHKTPATGKQYSSDVRKLFPKEMWPILFRYNISDDTIIKKRAQFYYKVS